MVVGTPILSTYAVNPDGMIDEFELGYLYHEADGLFLLLESLTVSDYQVKSRNCLSYVKEHHSHTVLGKKLLDFLGEPVLNDISLKEEQV
jgi:hypothetical protein